MNGLLPGVLFLFVALVLVLVSIIRYRQMGYTRQQGIWLLISVLFFIVGTVLLY